jgi:hypothetical protein
MTLTLIACEIAKTEFDHVIGKSSNRIATDYLEQGHHNDVVRGRLAIQERIDLADKGDCEAILLGYALCNNMLAGLQARSKPLVIARAHDCITWFLGSKECYTSEFEANPGTYYYTAGWLSVVRPHNQIGQSSSASGVWVSGEYAELVEQYGEDNAAYLWEVANGWIKNYRYGAYISMPGADHARYRQQVQEICARNSWEYKEIEGNLDLLQRWVDGDWNRKDFLVVKPGQKVSATFDSKIITVGGH